MLREFTFFITCFLIGLFITSCASTPPPKKGVISPEIQMKEIESSNQVKAMNERILMSAISSKRDLYRDYKIGPEDLLEISVFEEEKLNKTVRVSSQGNISLPLLGILRVKGLTANELEKEIRDLLAEKYLQDPHVSVFIKEYRSQRIAVIGAVEKPVFLSDRWLFQQKRVQLIQVSSPVGLPMKEGILGNWSQCRWIGLRLGVIRQKSLWGAFGM